MSYLFNSGWNWSTRGVLEYQFMPLFVPFCCVMTSQLLVVEETGIPSKKHRLTQIHWQLSHLPHAGYKPGQWWETVNCKQHNDSDHMHYCSRPLTHGNNCLTPSHWKLSHMPPAYRYKPGQWWETVNCKQHNDSDHMHYCGSPLTHGNNCLTPSHWKLSHMPPAYRYKPGQWWETVNCKQHNDSDHVHYCGSPLTHGNNCLTPSHWQLSHMPQARYKPRQWTVSSITPQIMCIIAAVP